MAQLIVTSAVIQGHVTPAAIRQLLRRGYWIHVLTGYTSVFFSIEENIKLIGYADHSTFIAVVPSQAQRLHVQ